MAMHTPGSGDGDDVDEVSDINVTPFIDVVLVLLIVFMVAAPLSTVDVPVDLPSSNAASKETPEEPVYLTVQEDLSLALGDADIQRDALAGQLDAATGGNKEERILLRADGAVNYADLMAVMNDLRRAGYLRIGLVGIETGEAGVSTGSGQTTPAPAPAGGD